MTTHTRIVTLVAALTAAAGFTAAGWAQQNNPSQGGSSSASPPAQNNQNSSSQNPGQSQRQSQSQQQTPEGFVMIEDNIVYLMANEPQNHFVQALADLRQNDKQKAAAEINIAASYIDGLASSEKGKNGQSSSLTQISQELRKRR